MSSDSYAQSREQIIAANPIAGLIERFGIKLHKSSNGNFVISCPFHVEQTPSCSIDVKRNLFHCFGCHSSGGVIDFVAKYENISIGEAMRKMSGVDSQPSSPPRWAPLRATLTPIEEQNAVASPTEGQEQALKEVAVYSYRDALGVEVFQVVRYLNTTDGKKTFRQRHMVNGQWVWSMEGVNRVLYNLPQILKSKSASIICTEGEKDADNLKRLGFVATTNVGGATKWLEGYSEALKGKDVVICGDNDTTGQKHVAVVLESICRDAKTVRVIKIPLPSKDISDFIATFTDPEAAAKAIFELIEDATVLTGGIYVPVENFDYLENQFVKESKAIETISFSLGRWLPGLARIRPLVPGEVFMIMAATGVGKSAVAENIAIAAQEHLPVLLFELELPGTLTFERFVALSTRTPASVVAEEYQNGRFIDWRSTNKLKNIFVCHKSNLRPADVERIIIQAEIKTGVRPKMVIIDYHQLAIGEGKTRYEKSTYCAEQWKVIAKNTNTILVFTSQIKRKESDESPEVKLSDGRDSGALEQSAGLVAGVWRDPKDATVMHIKILKGTKGGTGTHVECDFDGRTMLITQRNLAPVTAGVPSPSLPYVD